MNVPALKGVHYAMKSGMLAAETAVEAVGPGETSWAPGALDGYDEAVRESYIWSDLHARPQRCGPRSSSGFYRGALLAGALDHHARHAPARDEGARARRRRPRARSAIAAKATRPPDGKLVFDKLSSVYLSGNKTRDDAPSHIRVDTKVRRELAEAWVHMCPAQVYEVAGEASPAGNVVDVEVTASNCVQCGAITAKGGRLTPPEGGDGPEYTQM